METTLDLDTVLKFRQAKPFIPFAFELKSGVQLDVLEGTRFCTNGRGVLLFGPTGAIERFAIKDVVGLRVLDATELAAHIASGHFQR